LPRYVESEFRAYLASRSSKSFSASSLNISYANSICRSKIGLSGLGQVEMSGSRYVTGHDRPSPDHEQTRI
jgi:hypothetical protein